MSDYSTYFLNSVSSTVQLECFEISHSNFSQTYYICRNCTIAGVTVTHEDASVHAYTYYPINVEFQETRENLDISITLQLGDLGTIIPQELDHVRNADNFLEKPVVKYRTYRNDVLSTPMFGPLVLECPTLSSTWEGSALTAQAPSLNINKTGLAYNVIDFDMLRGFL